MVSGIFFNEYIFEIVNFLTIIFFNELIFGLHTFVHHTPWIPLEPDERGRITEPDQNTAVTELSLPGNAYKT